LAAVGHKQGAAAPIVDAAALMVPEKRQKVIVTSCEQAVVEPLLQTL
jgi:hypothetical protein